MQRGLYQNKVTSSLATIQRPGHWADSCKMVYWEHSQESEESEKNQARKQSLLRCNYSIYYIKHF